MMVMVMKEFVNGDAYVVSDEGEAVMCKCGNKTRTYIRVPSLNMYLPWCRACNRVPEETWKEIKPRVDNFDAQEQDLFNVEYSEFMRSGFDPVTAWRLAIDLYRKRRREKPLDEDEEKFSDEVSTESIIDLNVLLIKIVKRLTDEERKILALEIEEMKVDQYLSESVRAELFRDVPVDVPKYSKKEKARVLGYSTKDHTLKSYRKAWETMIRKAKVVMMEGTYDD